MLARLFGQKPVHDDRSYFMVKIDAGTFERYCYEKVPYPHHVSGVCFRAMHGAFANGVRVHERRRSQRL